MRWTPTYQQRCITRLTAERDAMRKALRKIATMCKTDEIGGDDRLMAIRRVAVLTARATRTEPEGSRD